VASKLYNFWILDCEEGQNELFVLTGQNPAKKSHYHPLAHLLFIPYLSSDSKVTTNPTSLIMCDNRQIVGSIVHGKAIHVTNEAE
jgi:hypothetical protein